ncbi:hypothetical protein G9A89_017220 [Geosiphon pyriformis]|nr:hypothetical protein G9A89_017220 [Geosiphon pyriformis]
MTAEKLANNHGVVVNTNLKHPNNNYMNWAINQADLLASKWSILIGKNAVHMARANGAALHSSYFIGSVGGKTCVIDHNPVSYACVCCTTICFGSESDLVSVMAATPVIKRIGFCWSCLSLVLCSVYKILGHTSLNCVLVKVGSTLRDRKAPLSAQNQVRLVIIYARKFMPISHPLAFSGKTWTSVVGVSPVHNSHGAGLLLGSNKVGKPFPFVAKNLNMHLINIKNSLISLAGQINELAKKLDSFVLAVSQPSLGCQLPVTLSLQNQGEHIVMGVGSSETISNGTATASVKNSSTSSHVAKLENMLEGLAALVLSLSACFDGLVLASDVLPQPPSQ